MNSLRIALGLGALALGGAATPQPNVTFATATDMVTLEMVVRGV